jgi:hypothetical protein
MLQPIQAGSPSAVAGSTVRPSAEGTRPATATTPVAGSPVTGFAHVERKPDAAELGNVVADLNDTQTDKVLRQIPTVEALKLWRSIEQMQGVMLRDTA